MRYSMHKFFDNYAATEQVAWISLCHPGLAHHQKRPAEFEVFFLLRSQWVIDHRIPSRYNRGTTRRLAGQTRNHMAVGDILVGVIKKPAATVPNLFEL